MVRDGRLRELGLEAACPRSHRPVYLYLILNLMGSHRGIYGIYIVRRCPWLLCVKAKWKKQDQGGGGCSCAVVQGSGSLGREVGETQLGLCYILR